MRGRTITVLAVLASAVPASAAVHHVATYPRMTKGSHCRLNRHRLTVCDAQTSSAKLARTESYDGAYAVWDCQPRSCMAYNTIGPKRLAELGIVVTGNTGTAEWYGLTRVSLHYRRICATWQLVYGRACV